MGFETRPKATLYKIEETPGINHVFYTEIFGTHQDSSIPNPITAAYLRIEKGAPVSPPRYTFDEAGVVLEGEVTIVDETGQTETLHQGDTFLFRRGTDLTISSARYGLIFKVEGAFMGADIPIKVHRDSNL